MNSVRKFLQQQRFLKHQDEVRKKSVPPKHLKPPKPKQQRIKIPKKLSPPLSKDYNVFLNSKYWLTVKEAVLKRDKYQCIICKSGDDLHVHHNTYRYHRAEHLHLESLDTLCGKCHYEVHMTMEIR